LLKGFETILALLAGELMAKGVPAMIYASVDLKELSEAFNINYLLSFCLLHYR